MNVKTTSSHRKPLENTLVIEQSLPIHPTSPVQPLPPPQGFQGPVAPGVADVRVQSPGDKQERHPKSPKQQVTKKCFLGDLSVLRKHPQQHPNLICSAPNIDFLAKARILGRICFASRIGPTSVPHVLVSGVGVAIFRET